MTATGNERDAMLRLALGVEPGTAGLAAEIAEFGASETLARVLSGRSVLGERARAGVAAADPARALGGMADTRVVLRGDLEYPGQLEDLDEPPIALWVRGPLDLRMSALRSVALVGARAASGYGQRVARDLGADLAASGWTVVSGAAFGIDGAAHRGALAVRGPTVAVLACGVDVSYPRAHDTLISAIADHGAVISELPPGSAPLKFRFLARNRLIAALTRATVVVEAAHRSGAISTANRALDLGRPLLAVPGPIDCPTSAGTNRLIVEKAADAVRDAADVTAAVLGGAFPGAAGGAGDAPTGAADATQLPPAAELVAGSLGGRAQPVAALAGRLQLDHGVVASMLGLLEVMGRARATPTGWVAMSACRG